MPESGIVIGKLRETDQRYHELEELLSKPETFTDIPLYTETMKEYRSLTPVITKYREYIGVEREADEAAELARTSPDPEMRALAFKYFMENKHLCINDGELIVGEKGDGPQKSPTFPELCCHTLEDMHVMNDRDLISFKVSEEDLKLQEEKIIPYWENRSIRHKIIAFQLQYTAFKSICQYSYLYYFLFVFFIDFNLKRQ